MVFNNKQNLFLLKSKWYKINSPTHVCLRRNYGLFSILTPWSYSKCNDILHAFNSYKISEKDHQVVDSWAAYEISVLEILFRKYLEYVPIILRNYKKLKRTKIVRFTITSFLIAQKVLVTTAE